MSAVIYSAPLESILFLATTPEAFRPVLAARVRQAR